MKHATLSVRTGLVAGSLAALLCACGGGGDGATAGGSSSTGATGSAGTSAAGAALLAAYTPPADIATAVVTNYTGAAFNAGNSGIVSSCASAARVGTTVVDAPDVIVFAANGASVKAQALAADLFEHQALPQIRAALGLAATGTAFDGTNKVQLCVDTALGASAGESGTRAVSRIKCNGSLIFGQPTRSPSLPLAFSNRASASAEGGVPNVVEGWDGVV